MNTPVSVLDNTFSCIFITDPNLKVTYWNNSIEIVSGILKDKAIGKNIFELIPSLIEECDYYFKQAVLKEKRIIELHLQRFTTPISENKIAVKARYFPNIENDKIIGLCGIWKQLCQDYEERDYLNLLKSVIVSTNDAVMITRPSPIDAPEGPVIIYSNPAFSKMTGYPFHEILGNTPRIVQGEDTDPQAKKNIRQALLKWQPIQQEILNYTKSGKKFWIDLSIVPVKNEEGYFTHWISVQRDVTEKKQHQRELEKMVEERTKELEKFIYFASHDLKEPLRMIYSFLDLLKRKLGDNLDQDSTEYLEFVQQGAKSMQLMIDGLLSYSRVQRAELKLQKVNFKDVIHAALTNLSVVVKESNATINIGEMPLVDIDFSLMINVMQNLILNAIEHCDLLPVIIISSAENENYYRIKINDNGIGISDKEILEIFNMFKKVNPNKSQKGSGIGLAVCKSIVEKHKGKILVESEEGQGCTFFIELPK